MFELILFQIFMFELILFQIFMVELILFQIFGPINDFKLILFRIFGPINDILFCPLIVLQRGISYAIWDLVL